MIDPKIVSKIKSDYINEDLEYSSPNMAALAEKYEVDYATDYIIRISRLEGWELIRQSKQKKFLAKIEKQEDITLEKQAIDLVTVRLQLFKENLEMVDLLKVAKLKLEDRLTNPDRPLQDKDLIAITKMLLALNIEMQKMIDKKIGDPDNEEDKGSFVHDLLSSKSIVLDIIQNKGNEIDPNEYEANLIHKEKILADFDG